MRNAKFWIAGLALLLALDTNVAAAQTAHQAVITWAAATDAVASSTYNVSRASGACPATGLGSLVFAKINAAPVAALTFTDAGLSVGTYCYFVSQVQSGAESIPSNTAGGVVRPNTVTIQIVIS